MNPSKVLVIEDESDIRELIHFHLLKENYHVLLAGDGEEGLRLTKKERPDLILLDIMLPKIDGLKVCQKIKANPQFKHIPIIIITAKGTEEDMVMGLDLGGDDYLTKPFSPKILMARIRSQLRKSQSRQKEQNQLTQISGIQIDPIKRKVSTQGGEIKLTYGQFQILHILTQKPGQVFSRSNIVDLVRGENHAITDRSVDVQIVLLRKKLGLQGNLIETVRGVGYRFKDTVS